MKKITTLLARCAQISFLLLFSLEPTFAGELDKQIGQLQVDVNSIEKEISDLEKDLLFPPLTRIEVYLSLATDINFILTSVKLSIDGEEKSFHIYSESDLTALRLGGLQSFWEGNVALGQHKLKADFIGTDIKGIKIVGVANAEFEKTQTGSSFELKITPANEQKVPAFTVKDWGNK